MRKDLTHDVEPPSPDERLRSARGQREGVELDGSRGARHTFLDLDRFVVSAHHDKDPPSGPDCTMSGRANDM
jgi:hypothetical protein